MLSSAVALGVARTRPIPMVETSEEAAPILVDTIERASSTLRTGLRSMAPSDLASAVSSSEGTSAPLVCGTFSTDVSSMDLLIAARRGKLLELAFEV